MPSGDRTGPYGLGAKTGRSLGYCAGYDTPGYMKGPGMGRGRGWGRGRGLGYGRGWGWGYRYPVYSAPIAYTPVYTQYTAGVVPQISPESQLSMLKQEKDYLESEMNGIKSAIDDISKKITDLEKEE